MRYMGDAVPLIPDLSNLASYIPGLGPEPSSNGGGGATPPTPAVTFTPLDPTQKRVAIAYAPNMPDAQAQDMLDIVDATNLGTRERHMRYAVGAAAGLGIAVAGHFLMKKLGRKKH